jgi:hypothetical protein
MVIRSFAIRRGRDRGRRPGVVALALTLGLVLALGGQAPASAQVAPIGTDIGTLRTDLFANGWNILRDSGYSASFTNAGGGQETFWVFGDSEVVRPAGSTATDPYPPADMLPWLRNNTAASGPFSVGAAPTALQEVGSSGTAPVVPRQLIPDPVLSATDTVVGNGTVPCSVGTDVRPWAQGAARIAGTTNQILVPYSTICTATGKVVASGFAQYNAVTEQLVANTPDVFQGTSLPQYLALQAPVFGFGENYLYFSKTCLANPFNPDPSCPVTRTYLVRVAWGWDPATARPWLNPAAYEWWSGGTTWTAGGATPLAGGPSLVTSPGISTSMVYQPAMSRYVLLEQIDVLGEEVRLSTATHPRGPWTAKAGGGTGCDRTGGTYPPDNKPVRHCRGLILHAELGSASSVVFSYAQVKNTVPRLEKPTDNQIRLRSVPITP